jgi:hypothetical protein
LAEEYRAVGSSAGAGFRVKSRPSAIDIIFLDAPRLRVGNDELLVVRDIRIVVAGNDTDRSIAEELKGSGCGAMKKSTVNARIRLHGDKGARRRSYVEQNSGNVGSRCAISRFELRLVRVHATEFRRAGRRLSRDAGWNGVCRQLQRENSAAVAVWVDKVESRLPRGVRGTATF